MKNFEILQELPKCDTKTRSEQMLLEKLCQQTYSTEGRHRPSIYLKKNEICVKHNKAKHNKTRCGLFRGHFTETQQIPIGLPWWVRLRTCNAGGTGLIPGQGSSRSHPACSLLSSLPPAFTSTYLLNSLACLILLAFSVFSVVCI